MSDNLVITIGRQYGSGGHEIARELSELMGIKMYDKELIDLAAKNSGLGEEILRSYDERPTNSFLYSLALGSYTMGYPVSGEAPVPFSDMVFATQAEIIRDLAEKESCIFVGRCADSVLKNQSNVLSVFIHADLEQRISRICEYENISRSAAADVIRKADKKRAGYYNYFSDLKWGVATSYDLCINSHIGFDNAARLIQFFAKHHKR